MEGLLTFAVVLLASYVGPFVILISPVLLVPRLRRRLTRREFAVVLYPPLVWAVLTTIGSRPKGMTNAYVELLLLAVGVALAVYLRVGLRRIVDARYAALFIPTAACLWVAVVARGIPPLRHFDLVRAWWYVRGRPELNEPMREAILHGVVVEGMSAEEAIVAGGPYMWQTESGELTRLSFNNLSQFGGDHPVAFNAYIVDGRVHEIERLHDLEVCLEYIENPKAEILEYPFVGFWKEDCTQSFGLRFEPGGSGRYAVRFCGPGGCGKLSQLNDCTPIPDGRNYAVLDQDTVVIRRGRREDTYKRCMP